MLADVLSNLRNIKEQNEKANEELAAKLMAENEKLAYRLSEKVQQEITKVTQAIFS
jgi:regulator of replication initiation timing